ncbi:MAG: hypothetical protein Q8O88_02975 [bacterium]|nr:hypothetical protein [bacterium]
MIDITFTLVSDSKLVENQNEPLPSTITELLNPFECKENDTVFIPHITIQRLDIQEENYILENPKSLEGKGRSFLGTYSYVDLKNDYEEMIPKMKAGEYLSKPSSKGAPATFNLKKNSLVYYLSDKIDKEKKNFKSIKEIRSNIDSLLCSKEITPQSQIYIVFNNKNEFTQTGINNDSINPPPPPDDTCTQTTVTDGLNLKEDLMKIVDTKRSYKERDRLARETWKKYFDTMASVKYYIKANQKYPEGFFESGDGANYFIDRLAYMSSITDVNIIRIEYHKENHKVSGIVVVECHNASEIQ